MTVTAPLAILALPLASALVLNAPVPPLIPLRVTAAFAPPTTPWGAGHRGVDLAGNTDQPVASLSSGRIGFSGSIGGKAVVTVHLEDGRRVTYEPVISELREGDAVRPGQIIGLLAAAGGHCGGRAGCLHIGLLRGAEYLDPLTLLAPRAVLKPWPER